MAWSLTGCTQTVAWTEDVRLLDGSVVTVAQKRLCQGGDYTAATNASCLARDAWVTLHLPAIAPTDIVWHESLNPMVINVYQGRLFIVGTPPTSLEFRKYGAVNPPYVGYVWTGQAWQRLAFAAIPVAIYDGNMLPDSIPMTRTAHVTLEQKYREAHDGFIRPPQRIDPAYKILAH